MLPHHGADLRTKAELHGKRMLVVDDNENARMVLVDMLGSMRFEVESVASGPAAVAAVRDAATSGRPFAIVFLDWQMPGMDGIEAGRQIKALGLPAPPHLIMVSAYGREEMQKGAEAAGFDDTLIKPVSPSMMFDVVMRVLGAEQDDMPGTGEAAGAVAAEAAVAALKDRRVLLVEDNEFNQQVASEMLADMGMAVEVAENGRVAIDKVAAGRYDIVLMDMQMPVMDGLTATMEIRRNGHADLPIVAMTANAMQADRDKCLAAGMNDHLAKPIDPDALAATLVKWTRSAPPAAPAAGGRPDLPEIDEDIFDFERIGPIFKWNMARMKPMLSGFLSDAAAKVAALHDAVGGGDPIQVRQVAHGLKGTANTAGAVRLGRMAADIETAAIAGQTKSITRLLPLVAPTLAELESALTPVLTEKGSA